MITINLFTFIYIVIALVAGAFANIGCSISTKKIPTVEVMTWTFLVAALWPLTIIVDISMSRRSKNARH